MFEVHTSWRPIRVESYATAIEIANQFFTDYGILVAVVENDSWNVAVEPVTLVRMEVRNDK